jgi:spore coat protein U-like protein
MLFKKTLLASALLALGGFAVNAGAATGPATTTFQVKLVVQKACSVNATDLDFGSHDATDANFGQTTSGTVTVTCSKNTPYVVGLSPSNGNGAGAGSMSSGTTSDTVAYQLYQDSNLSSPWGNTGSVASPGNEVSGNGLGTAAAALNVYAKVTSANVEPGTYADTVNVNVTY